MNRIVTPSTTREIVTVKLSSENETFGIVAAGDFHVGAAAFNEPAFFEFIKDLQYYSEKEHVYVILMGDLFDAIMLSDKRFYGKAQAGTIDESMDFICNAFKPCLSNPKIHFIGSLTGNHELSYCRGDTDLIYRMYNRTDIKPLGSECFILFDMMLEDKIVATLRTVAYHGSKNSMTEHGKVKIIRDFVDNNLLQYDKGIKLNHIGFFGHTHGCRVEHVRELIPEPRVGKNGRWAQIHMCGCLTGSFFDTANFKTNSYAQDKGYKPMPIGYIKGSVSVANGFDFWTVVDKFNPRVRSINAWDI